MKKRLLYVCLPAKNENAYWLQNIQRGVHEAARERQDAICIVDADTPVSELVGKPVIVLDGAAHTVEALEQSGARPIAVGRARAPGICNAVSFEFEESIRHCLQLLRRAGRRRTALVGLNPNSFADLAKARIFSDKRDIYYANETLAECIHRFAGKLAETDYDSVICANDTAAIRLIDELSEHGIRVPEQLYVIGMGSFYAGVRLSVPLTSVILDYCELGRAAVRLAHMLFAEPNGTHASISIPCHLVIRESAPLTEGEMLPRETKHLVPSHYFEGDGTQSILRIEAMLQAVDAIDRELLFLLAQGEPCEAIAARLFLTDRAIRYRLTKLVERYGFSDRAELEATLRQVILSNKKEITHDPHHND